jgi:hypothetical protein
MIRQGDSCMDVGMSPATGLSCKAMPLGQFRVEAMITEQGRAEGSRGVFFLYWLGPCIM